MSPIDFIATRSSLGVLAEAEGGAGRPFVLEALTRLDQLHWLCERVAYVEKRAASIDWRAWEKSAHSDYFHPCVIELQTLTEAFYYIAWRLIALLDRDDGPIPGLRGLRSRCVGIRTVRNKLLEHPEAVNSRIHVPAIMFGTPGGPRLKFVAEVKTGEDGALIFRTNTSDLFDNGLWANAEELKSAIDANVGRVSAT